MHISMKYVPNKYKKATSFIKRSHRQLKKVIQPPGASL